MAAKPPGPARARYSKHLVDLLVEEGVEASVLLAGTGLESADLEPADARIDFDAQLRIYANALERSRDPELGYRLGSRHRISDHGVYGYAIQSSADLGQALRVLVKYQAASGPLLDMTLEDEGGIVAIVLSEVVALGRIGRMACEEALTSIVRGLLSLTDPATEPVAVHLERPADAPERARHWLGARVVHDQRRTEIRLRRLDLARPLIFANEETAAVCEQRCAELIERLGRPADIVERVQRWLVSEPGRFAGLDQTARGLGMSGRTLRRRLQAAGTSFQQVLSDLRRGLALDYLERSDLSIDEIASLLGYAETSNFYRAFRRWTGRPPGAYRPARSDGLSGRPRGGPLPNSARAAAESSDQV